MKTTAFQVSVITPVYNAATRVRRAIESAVALQEVGEVILVEDGSPDNALEICHDLELEFEKVRLFQHADRQNHGAGASRNLGIRNASFPFVAFLDADDWYLPNRFEADRRLLLSDASIDGIYNALGNHYESDELRGIWLGQGRPEIETVSEAVPPGELFFVLLHCHPTVFGEFHTNTITVRREFYERVGTFHEGLRLQQDTHLWKRMAAGGRLAAGNISEPVAIRGVHAANRMTRVEDHEQYRELWWSDLRRCLRKLGVPTQVMQAYRRSYAGFRAPRRPAWRGLLALADWVLREPRELLPAYGHFDLTLRTILRCHWTVNRLLSLPRHQNLWANSRSGKSPS